MSVAGARKVAAAREIVGIGRVVLWNGGSLWIGRDVGKAQPHAHHAIQLSFALDDTLQLFDDSTKTWKDYAAAIVLPHHTHQFDGAGKSVAQIFVEPETAQGRALLQRYPGVSIAALPAEPCRSKIDGPAELIIAYSAPHSRATRITPRSTSLRQSSSMMR